MTHSLKLVSDAIAKRAVEVQELQAAGIFDTKAADHRLGELLLIQSLVADLLVAEVEELRRVHDAGVDE